MNKEGIVSLRTFAGLEEDRKAVRTVLQSDFGLDPAGNLALRSDVALLLCVWESARTQLSVQEKNRQESKLGMQQRIVQPSDYATMRSAVEAKHGRLKDREAPSKGMIASKLEQVEDGAPIAEDLRKVTSFADSEVEAYNAIIDPSMGFLRIRPGKTTTTPPSTPEELRLRHRRIGLAWDFVKARHTTRAHALGCLHHRSTRSANCPIMFWVHQSLVCARPTSEVPRGLWSPLMSWNCERPLIGLFSPASGSPTHEKGFGKGKQMPSWDRQWGKSSKTPEGKPICFKFQKGRCSDKACRFAHACQRCFGRHPFTQCRFKKEAGNGRVPEEAAS